MPRTNLDKGLQELHAQIIQIALEVENALVTTLTSLETGIHHPLPQIIEKNLHIASICATTQHQALRLLILQQPLGGQDLRFLTAALYICDNLNRIWDAIVEIVQTLLDAAALYRQSVSSSLYGVDGSAIDQHGHLTDVFILRGLLFLGREIEHILTTLRIAFTQRDLVLARSVKGEEQDMLASRYTPICQDIIEMQAQMASLSIGERDASFIQRITDLLWIAHKLAEIATSATQICKRIIFIVEGEPSASPV